MSIIKIGRTVMGVCATNVYFIYQEGQEDCIVVDPADQGRMIFAKLRQNGLRPAGILLTHGHFDHIWGCDGLRDAANEYAAHHGLEPIRVYANELEKELLGNARLNVSEQMGRPYTMEADVYLRDGETVEIAGLTCRMLSTPGHTAGGCCYYFGEAGFAVCGDTLFQESVGRTDFPTGSMSTLVRSVQDKLFTLPEDTTLYPGHGDSTTVAHEKQYNPFCQ